MKTKIMFLILAGAGIVAGVLIITHHGTTTNAAVATKPEVATSVPAAAGTTAAPLTASSNPLPSAAAPQPSLAKPNIAGPALQTGTDSADQSLKINGYVVQDPTARLALRFVGNDPDAEAYWEQAVNDPNLPAEERKDLIEDLNEDGLANPHQATPADLPIIANRIQLIEQLAPYAMDKVDADAFAEAYKDLVNLYNGQPAD